MTQEVIIAGVLLALGWSLLALRNHWTSNRAEWWGPVGELICLIGGGVLMVAGAVVILGFIFFHPRIHVP